MTQSPAEVASQDAPVAMLSADLALIYRCIPHRFPFLFVDKVHSIVPHKSAIGVKNVTFNEPYFNGHFPGNPVMPGVLQLEAMAQAARLLRVGAHSVASWEQQSNGCSLAGAVMLLLELLP